MEKCLGCQYYDRGNSQSDARGIQWGQCRRSAPRLHPVNQKTFMIEGVWPHVRDDDWCGEWRGNARRSDSRAGADGLPAMPLGGLPSAPARPGGIPARPDMLLPGSAAAPRAPMAPGGSSGARPATSAIVSAFNGAGASAAAQALGSLRASGRGD